MAERRGKGKGKGGRETQTTPRGTRHLFSPYGPREDTMPILDDIVTPLTDDEAFEYAQQIGMHHGVPAPHGVFTYDQLDENQVLPPPPAAAAPPPPAAAAPPPPAAAAAAALTPAEATAQAMHEMGENLHPAPEMTRCMRCNQYTRERLPEGGSICRNPACGAYHIYHTGVPGGEHYDGLIAERERAEREQAEREERERCSKGSCNVMGGKTKRNKRNKRNKTKKRKSRRR
jgi:hypothetical protein